MSVDQLLTALAVTVPEGQTLWSYDALADAATGSAAGLALLKANIQVANLVTSGANMLTNDSSLYASFAIIMNQALAKKVKICQPLSCLNACDLTVHLLPSEACLQDDATCIHNANFVFSSNALPRGLFIRSACPKLKQMSKNIHFVAKRSA